MTKNTVMAISILEFIAEALNKENMFDDNWYWWESEIEKILKQNIVKK
jgi:hypothetical protein